MSNEQLNARAEELISILPLVKPEYHNLVVGKIMEIRHQAEKAEDENV